MLYCVKIAFLSQIHFVTKTNYVFSIVVALDTFTIKTKILFDIIFGIIY